MAQSTPHSAGCSVEPIVLKIVALVLQGGNRCVPHVSGACEDATIAHGLQCAEIVYQGAILCVRELSEAGNLQMQ